jgi:hypothetical protein
VFVHSCPIMCLYVLSYVLWCSLRFPYKNYIWFIFISSCVHENSCLIYVTCVCVCKVVSNTYCVVFFCFVFFVLLPVSLDYSFLIVPSVFSNVYLRAILIRTQLYHIVSCYIYFYLIISCYTHNVSGGKTSKY